ncbi:hypothetical protein CKO28_16085 [Rhodovibrio sodomensis]|uniref:N-acetyltransferase domain-containing protein n=1 Tax=Rhodovibrio sodomensis TaxID=1088 RepID=A0ABS1DI94_9PROT|nr:hypothetical protein [Rhodovibrio sodomensis]MBK1669559.1 hypothetical protein [Rhodovibrio sodomensis]
MTKTTYRLSDLWSRKASRGPGLRYSRSAAECVLGRFLTGWRHGEEVAIVPVSKASELSGVRRSFAGVGDPDAACEDLGIVIRTGDGGAEAVTGVSLGADEDPIGALRFDRRLVQDADLPGGTVTLDLEIDINRVYVAPRYRGLGHGALLGVSAARTVLSDVRTLLDAAADAADRLDLCVAVAGECTCQADDRIVWHFVRTLRHGLEMLEPVHTAWLADLRVSLDEVMFNAGGAEIGPNNGLRAA